MDFLRGIASDVVITSILVFENARNTGLCLAAPYCVKQCLSGVVNGDKAVTLRCGLDLGRNIQKPFLERFLFFFIRILVLKAQSRNVRFDFCHVLVVLGRKPEDAITSEYAYTLGIMLSHRSYDVVKCVFIMQCFKAAQVSSPCVRVKVIPNALALFKPGKKLVKPPRIFPLVCGGTNGRTSAFGIDNGFPLF